MKKYFFLLLLTVFFQSLTAQPAYLTFGGNSKEINWTKTNIGRTSYIGADQGSTYIMQCYMSDKKGTVLKRFDKDMCVLAQQKLEESYDEDNLTLYLGGFLSKDAVSLFRQHQDEKTFVASRVQYDPATLEPKGEPTEIRSISLNSGDDVAMLVATSSDYELLAGIYLLKRAGQDAEAQISLYDTEFEEYWRMDCPVKVLDCYLLTDSGEVLLGGFYTQKNEKSTHFELSYLDGERQMTYNLQKDMGDVRSMNIVRYAHNRIYITGTIQDPSKSKINQICTSEIYVLVYNTATRTIENYTTYKFSPQDYARLNNKSERFEPKSTSVDFASFFTSLSDEKGALICYRQKYIDMSFNYFYGGLLFLRIDDKGDIDWTHPIRTMSSSLFAHRSLVNSTLFRVDNQMMFTYTEKASNFGKDITKPFKTYRIEKDEARLVVCLIDRDGKFSLQYFDIPKGSAILGAPHRIANNKFQVLTIGSSKACLGELKIER